MDYQGDYAEDATVYVMFNTFTSDDPSASSTITNFINTDVHIHKDDGLTQRNNAAGITVSVDFDGITGSHMIKIDTSDDTVGGFWVTASDYFVRIEGTTVDGATINVVVGHFSIENRFNQTVVPDAAGTAPTAVEIQAEMEENGASLLDTIRDDLDNATDGLGALKALIDAIPTTAMRGTDNAALASVCTEARLAELAAANLPANVDTLLTRITAAVALASVCTEARLAELDAANLPADADTIKGHTDTLEADLKTYLDAIETNLDGDVAAVKADTVDIESKIDNVYDGVNDNEAKIDILDTVADGIQTDLSNATDGLGALKALIDTLDTVADAIKAKTDNQPAGVPKNVAWSNFEFLMVDSTDHITPKTGLTVTAQISKDGGAFAGSTNSAAEVANGVYKINWTQAEMNAGDITFKLTATGADQRTITIKTST